MKTIYLDPVDYKCHVTDNDTMIAFDTDFFDGKSPTYIEGHRIVPAGHKWTRNDGVVFEGEMKTAWRDIKILNEFQAQYEAQNTAASDAYTEGVNSI